MARPKRDEFLRHEPSTKPIVRKKVTTQRNLRSPVRPGDDAETFGSTPAPTPAPTPASIQTFDMRESQVVNVPRDRTPKGVSDGRGKRSVKDVLLSTPTPEGKAIYLLERIASLEDQIVKLLGLVDNETREIVFKRRATIKQNYWDE